MRKAIIFALPALAAAAVLAQMGCASLKRASSDRSPDSLSGFRRAFWMLLNKGSDRAAADKPPAHSFKKQSGLRNKIDLSGRDLSEEDLRDWDMRGRNLANTLLQDSDLSGVPFEGALIRGAKFDRARLYGADFGRQRRFNLGETSWKGALYDERTIFPWNFNPADHGMIFNLSQS